VVSYGRDGIGRIASVTTTVNGVATVIASNRTYRADGLLVGQSYGNGINEVRTYDTQGRLTYQSLGGADTRVYEYDANGNLTRKQSLPEVASYGYDALDRLVSEASATLTASFGYDANGNRLSASVNNLNATLGYAPGSNRLTQVSAAGRTLPVALDASGNTVGLPTLDLALAYDGAGRLTTIDRRGTVIARYVYNAHGQRTRKVVGTQTIVYHYDLAGNLIAETTSNGIPIRAYVYADDTPLAQITKTTSESLVYLHADSLGTPRLATDTNRRVIWSWEGEAFGSTPPNEDTDGDGKRTTVNLRFPGQYADAETGLFYNWNRYYSPQLGRYITSDPIGLGGGLNTYAYVDNNPLRWFDPEGMAKMGGGKIIPFPLPAPPALPGAPTQPGVGDVPGDDTGTGSRSRERPGRERPNCPELCNNVGEYLLKRFRPGDMEYEPARPGLALYRCDYQCPSGKTFSRTMALREGFGGCPTPITGP